jgi:hypothetical protein
VEGRLRGKLRASSGFSSEPEGRIYLRPRSGEGHRRRRSFLFHTGGALSWRCAGADTGAMTAAPLLVDLEADVSGLSLEQLSLPEHLLDSMTTDAVVGLLLLRMRALIARGFDPTEALMAAAGLKYVQIL